MSSELIIYGSHTYKNLLKTRQLWYLIKGILLTRGRGIKEKHGGVRGGGGSRGGGGGVRGGGGWNPLMEDERDGGQVEAAAGCSLQCEAGEEYFHQPLAASKELEGVRRQVDRSPQCGHRTR